MLTTFGFHFKHKRKFLGHGETERFSEGAATERLSRFGVSVINRGWVKSPDVFAPVPEQLTTSALTCTLN